MCKSRLCPVSTYTYWTLVQSGLQGACQILDQPDAAATSFGIFHLLEGPHHLHGLTATGEPVLCCSLVEQELVDSGSQGLRHTSEGRGRGRGRVRHAVSVAELGSEIAFCVWR